MSSYGFDYINKSYIDILEDIELMIDSINVELDNFKYNNLTTHMFNNKNIVNNVYFEMLYIDTINIKLVVSYYNNGEDHKYIIPIEIGHKVEYHYQTELKNGKIVHTIKIATLKPTGKKVDNGNCDICTLDGGVCLVTEIGEYKMY